MPDAEWKRLFRQRLVRWFRRHARSLPWRETRDPYHVWVSEIMLQQTQVATVIPYFTRFIAAFPTVTDLAAAPEEQVLKLWEGLGYYRRARQMHLAAQTIVREHNGEFPRTFEAVRALPGIGRYTAGAILSIAHDERLPILEANTVRLFARLLAYAEDPTATAGQSVFWQFAEELLPAGKAGEFNQALMELGSLICVPRNPRCLLCPAVHLCPTYATGRQAEIPLAKKAKNFESVRECYVAVESDGRIFLRRCQPGERWAGLWDFPRFPLEAEPDAIDQARRALRARWGIRASQMQHLTTIKHGVTRFRITVECFGATAKTRTEPASADGRWVRWEELETLPLTTTARRLRDHLRASPQPPKAAR